MLPPDPTVDVIVATNRLSPFLDEAVRSVAAQTWPHWRLLVVDDGSPEPAALDRAVAGVERARVLHREHAGVSAARNAGLAATTGDLVAFLDDDDVWEPTRLAAQVAALRHRPEAVGAFCAGTYVDEDGRPRGTGWTAAPAAPERFLDGSLPAPRIVTLLVTRTVCRAVGGFDESLWLAEDNDFVLRVLQEGPLACVPEALVRYRRHPGNASQVRITEGRWATDRLLAKQIAAAALRGDRHTAGLLRRHRRRHHRRAAEESVSVLALTAREHDRSAFTEELRWAARHAPVATAAAAGRRAWRFARGRADRGGAQEG